MIEHLDGIFETVDFHGQKGVRINELTVQEDFPAHWHTAVEIIRVKENGYKIIAAGKICELTQGDIALIRPGIVHELYAPAQGRRTIFMADINGMRNVGGMETLLAILPPVAVITEAEPELYRRIDSLMESMEEEDSARASFYEMKIYAALLDILVVLGRQVISRQPGGSFEDAAASRYGKQMMEVCSYINEHCTEGLTLSQMAHMSGFSKYHFTRIFKEFTHTSFYQYLSEKRVSHAEQLLANPDYSITEVAVRSGYSSLPAFIRMFRQWKGCTPSEFRGMYSPDCLNRREQG